MADISSYVEAAKKSTYFSGWHLGADLARFLSENAGACRALADRGGTDLRHIFLVGSGGSFANMQTVKYVFDGLLDIPVDVVSGHELVWRAPLGLGPGSIALFVSWSGETEDAVAALRFARERGAHTVAIVCRADTTLAREAHDTIAYASSALYELPIAALLLFGGRLAKGAAAEEAAAIERSLFALPPLIEAAVRAEEDRAEARAREFLHATHMYVLGAGPLSPLAYKIALTVVMENVRIGGTYCDASEFRHGPAEALERNRPPMMFLVGTDESRPVTLQMVDFCKGRGAHALVYDAADAGGEVHPLLTSFVLNSLVQWFVVYSAILRGILDLDERVFMGHQVLGKKGARWP